MSRKLFSRAFQRRTPQTLELNRWEMAGKEREVFGKCLTFFHIFTFFSDFVKLFEGKKYSWHR